VEITFDPLKNARNIRGRGLSFEGAIEFDFATAILAIDTRQEYGEVRYVAVDYLESRLHVFCFTETQSGIRVTSFRKANAREIKRLGWTRHCVIGFSLICPASPGQGVGPGEIARVPDAGDG
jgi:uncharacterized DUF497 family protein